KERVASLAEGATHDCAYGDERCTACGTCDYEVVDTIVYHPEDYKPERRPPAPPPPEGRATLRLRYAKEGCAVALSHLETMTALLRAFRRAKLSIPHTQGFHPKPRVSFGPACPVGTESRAEYLDLELHGTPDVDDVAEQVRRELPGGFRLLSCERIDDTSASLNRVIRAIEYRVELPDGAPDASTRLAEFAARADVAIVREREGKDPVSIDLKSAVHSLAAESPRELRFTLRAGANHATARPSELLSALFSPEWVKPGVARIVRENVVFGPAAA